MTMDIANHTRATDLKMISIRNSTPSSSPTSTASESPTIICVDDNQQQQSPTQNLRSDIPTSNNNNNSNSNSNNNNSNSNSNNKKTNIKRSFDVAFLMLPDEKLKHKYCGEKLTKLNTDAIVTYPNNNHLNQYTSIKLKQVGHNQNEQNENDEELEHYHHHHQQQLQQLHHQQQQINQQHHQHQQHIEQINNYQKFINNSNFQLINSNAIQNELLKNVRNSTITNYHQSITPPSLSPHTPPPPPPPSRPALSQAVTGPTQSLQNTSPRALSQSSSQSPSAYDDTTTTTKNILNINDNNNEHPKSAFTKVPHIRVLDSPIPSISPDQLSCSSASPPMSTASSSSSPTRSVIYQNFRPEYQFINNNGMVGNVSGISSNNNSNQLHAINQFQQVIQHQKLKQQQQQAQQHHHQQQQQQQHPAQFMYRPIQNHIANMELSSANYMTSGTGAFPFITAAGVGHHPFAISNANGGSVGGGGGGGTIQQNADISGMVVRNPAAAAALLTTLIPPTIATSFTLTAQNVCAKCNISFRMTSDLVYHMRSHHKTEFAGDTNRRKREEKLKCPVCNESFRERHHLTRHMTAHQDKASDETDLPIGNGGINGINHGLHHHGNRRQK